MKCHLLMLVLLGSAQVARAATAVDDLFKQAQTTAADRKFDEALALYERVFLEHPEAVDRWPAAQKAIAETLARKGDLAAAAQAARLYFDSAPNASVFKEAVALTANILSALDKNVDRANQFISFQQTGPTNGLTNPLEVLGYPVSPGREQAFAAARRQAGDDVAAARFRALTFLYTGKPKEAFAQLSDAFRRSSKASDVMRAGQDLVLIGLRAVRGHAVGLDAALQFVNYGPAGPDGKVNTADDLADPFTAWLTPVPAEDQDGLVEVTAEELAALRNVRDGALLFGGDPYQRSPRRNSGFAVTALQAAQRANEALDAWGMAGQRDWYLQRVFDPAVWRATGGDPIIAALLEGASAAARNRTLHLGGVRALWAEIDARCAAQKLTPPRGFSSARTQFNSVGTGLEQARFPLPPGKPLKVPLTY